MALQTNAPEPATSQANQALQAARKAAIEANAQIRESAGETPAPTASNTDLLRAVDAQTGVEYFIPISAIASAPPDLSTYIESSDFDSIVKLTQAAYDALGVKVARTFYVIVG